MYPQPGLHGSHEVFHRIAGHAEATGFPRVDRFLLMFQLFLGPFGLLPEPPGSLLYLFGLLLDTYFPVDAGLIHEAIARIRCLGPFCRICD